MFGAESIMSDSDWDKSAEAWIRHLGPEGDRGRRYVLDPAIYNWLDGKSFSNALDVGCGEGRFCRMMQGRGIQTTGIDPTERLISQARALNPDGAYRVARAENLPFEARSFDLAVTYLSLIDIPDFRTAISEMARVLRPGGALLAANLTSYNSAGDGRGWKRDGFGRYKYFKLDNYLEERANQVSFAGIEIENWHRPLSAYMQAYLTAGLRLEQFEEPPAIDGEFAERYNRAPWFNLMVWRKPL